MKKTSNSITFLLLASMLIFSACPDVDRFETGHFSTSVINFEELNTEYDDYNSSAPFIRDVFPLCFSSNRNSQGGQFDIVYKLIAINFDKETAELKIYNESNNNLGIVINNEHIFHHTVKANTSNNEFGPYVRNFGLDLLNHYQGIYDYSDELYEQSLLMFATEEDGNLDIKYIHNIEGEELDEALPISYINTDFNEAYPTFDESLSAIYYCSDEEGNYNIYKVPFNNSIKIQNALGDTTVIEKEKISSLSSEGDDKCPYIEKDVMVFSSNKLGGFGGYDLYYSKLENGTWSQPINMGNRINTASDEFRPILKYIDNFDNDFLLFSSNRSGGKGGFDLYYTGVSIFK